MFVLLDKKIKVKIYLFSINHDLGYEEKVQLQLKEGLKTQDPIYRHGYVPTAPNQHCSFHLCT
jgi:hypothetical protein